MSESKSQSIFPLWESLGKLNHRSFTRTGPLRPDWSLIVPTRPDSGSTFGSSASDNVWSFAQPKPWQHYLLHLVRIPFL